MFTRVRQLTLVMSAVAMTVTGSAMSESPEQSELTRSGPVVCDGTQEMVLRGRLIEAGDVAVSAEGTCNLEIIGSRIVADGTALETSGTATIKLFDSHVSGRDFAVRSSGMSTVSHHNSRIEGNVSTSGFATVEKASDSSVAAEAADSSTSRDAVSVQADSSVEIGADGEIRVRDAEGETAVDVGPGGDVRVNDRGKQTQVDVREDRKVVVDDNADTEVRVGTDRDKVDVQDDSGATFQMEADGSIRADDGLTTVAVDDEWVGVRSKDGAADVQVARADDWRDRTGSIRIESDTAQVLVDLGATKQEGTLEMDLAGDVLFDFDSVQIRPEAARQLAKVAHVIRDRATGRVEVIGHTDAKGSEDYNKKLSQQRAISVMRWLNTKEGIPAEIMVGKGKGSSKPIAHNTMPDGSDNPEGRAKNRRVEIRLATGS